MPTRHPILDKNEKVVEAKEKEILKKDAYKKEGNKFIRSEVVKSSFYKYLAENFKKQQVIVLENADPQKELLDKINYYHFTKNRNN